MAYAHSILERRGKSATEEQLLTEIAYYKARLADIRRAPAASRHRDVLRHVSERLHEREQMLAQLRDCEVHRVTGR